MSNCRQRPSLGALSQLSKFARVSLQVCPMQVRSESEGSVVEEAYRVRHHDVDRAACFFEYVRSMTHTLAAPSAERQRDGPLAATLALLLEPARPSSLSEFSWCHDDSHDGPDDDVA